MAAIDEVRINEYLLTESDSGTVREIFRGAVWRWYHQHQDDIVLRKWFFAWRVSDLRFIFSALVGDEAS